MEESALFIVGCTTTLVVVATFIVDLLLVIILEIMYEFSGLLPGLRRLSKLLTSALYLHVFVTGGLTLLGMVFFRTENKLTFLGQLEAAVPILLYSYAIAMVVALLYYARPPSLSHLHPHH